MGLRFRKSVSILPGLKLNFGKTGVSVSTGVPGFRKTIHSSGKVTTTVGIPGTGLYYVDTKNPKKENQNRRRNTRTRQEESYDYSASINFNPSEFKVNPYSPDSGEQNFSSSDIPSKQNQSVAEPLEQINTVALLSIHKTSDDTIDWTEVLVHPTAPDECYNQIMWEYYHTMAPKVLAGDIDAYLQLIYEVNPLDDLLVYGSNYEFGTDHPTKIEVEFQVNERALSDAKRIMSKTEYNLLLQDYISSMSIRIARDMFALLPIRNSIVHTVLNGDLVLSVNFDRAGLSKIKFGYIDPSDVLSKFQHNEDFNEQSGYNAVTAVE